MSSNLILGSLRLPGAWCYGPPRALASRRRPPDRLRRRPAGPGTAARDRRARRAVRADRAEVHALSILRDRPGLSNAQLARRSYVTPQSMNEVLAALEAEGWSCARRPPTTGACVEISAERRAGARCSRAAIARSRTWRTRCSPTSTTASASSCSRRSSTACTASAPASARDRCTHGPGLDRDIRQPDTFADRGGACAGRDICRGDEPADGRSGAAATCAICTSSYARRRHGAARGVARRARGRGHRACWATTARARARCCGRSPGRWAAPRSDHRRLDRARAAAASRRSIRPTSPARGLVQVPGGPAHLRPPDRRGEPARRRAGGARQGDARERRASACDELFPILARARAPARRPAVRRRAADARDRPRADGRARACCCSTSPRSASPRGSSSRSAR